MSTSDVIVSKIEKGSFKFPVQFELFGNNQNILEATFDTGCSHSLVSVSSLNIGNKTIKDLEHEALTDVDVMLAIGVGVESNNEQTKNVRKYIRQINKIKEQLKQQGKSKSDSKNILKRKITPKIENIISNSKNVRYEYIAHNYSIDGVEIGDIYIRLSFHTEHKNLIGMHIIKKLYTKIFSVDTSIFMIATLDRALSYIAEKEIIENYKTSTTFDFCSF